MCVGTGVGVSVGAWAVGVATMDLAMAVVAEMSGVGTGVGPQAAVKVTIRTRGNSFFMLLSSLALHRWREYHQHFSLFVIILSHNLIIFKFFFLKSPLDTLVKSLLNFLHLIHLIRKNSARGAVFPADKLVINGWLDEGENGEDIE